MNKHDGGTAFPCAWVQVDDKHNEIDSGGWSGMTLRDYFAGQVLAGRGAGFIVRDIDQAAELAYRIADTMLEARDQ